MENKLIRKTDPRRERGIVAERRAEAYLVGLGYTLLERNFRWRGGEIDLILIDAARKELVFAEVRSAQVESARGAHWLRQSISGAKRRHLIHTAQTYLWRRPQRRDPKAFRFDFLWVVNGRVEHWRNVLL